MTLLEEWREFERNIVPQGTDATTRSKMQFLFYSGALSLFDRLVLAEQARDPIALHRELHELANSVAAVYRDAPELAVALLGAGRDKSREYDPEMDSGAEWDGIGGKDA
jgi:hypothetical protein